jgi:urease accessory protein
MDERTDFANAAMLSDGRFPVGGHAHSAGFEAATTEFDLSDEGPLVTFLTGRLATTGVTEAHLVAAIRDRLDNGRLDWLVADAEIEARTASPALRSTSRTLGRHWMRAARHVFPGEHIEGLRSVTTGPHQVAAFAATTAQAGIAPDDAVRIHLHHLVTAVLGAAVRLHGLDPFRSNVLQVTQRRRCEAIVTEAVASAGEPWERLPAPSGPLTEILAEVHAAADGRLFRS